MADNHLNNPKSPKYHVKKYLDSCKEDIKNKVVIDIPAGNGVTTQVLLDFGAKAEAFDLFPEYFMIPGHECKRADINQGIPVENNHADMLICQEGIEHFSDQLKALKEFNRVLKMNGRVVITTPSYSNLAAKLNYLLFESETAKKMPPNEIDDIWMSDKSKINEIYHGHIFLIGLQKMRVLGKLAGFDIQENRYLRISKTSLLLFPIFYPFIFLSSYLRYFKMLKKHKDIPYDYKKKVYKEQLMLNISPGSLLNHHSFVVLEKTIEADKVDFRLESIIKPFEKLM